MKVFCLFYLKLPLQSKVRILSSIDYPAQFTPLGCRVAAGMECIPGSEMYLATTGIPNSHMYIFLSSAVETKRLPFSMNVIVLMVPICSSYC